MYSHGTEEPEDRKKANVIGVFKEGKRVAENHRLVSLTLIPGKRMEQVMLKTVSEHIKDKKVIGSNQHGFMKGKTCVTDLTDFYNKIICLVEKGRVGDDSTLSLGSLPALSPVLSSWTNLR